MTLILSLSPFDGAQGDPVVLEGSKDALSTRSAVKRDL
jgi:hypothetical protein